jgi:hypothetical protein
MLIVDSVLGEIQSDNKASGLSMMGLPYLLFEWTMPYDGIAAPKKSSNKYFEGLLPW